MVVGPAAGAGAAHAHLVRRDAEQRGDALAQHLIGALLGTVETDEARGRSVLRPRAPGRARAQKSQSSSSVSTALPMT